MAIDSTLSANPQAFEQYRTAKALFNNGEYFRSYDLAKEGLEAWPEQMVFAHLAVLSLANAGATEMALEKFSSFGLKASAGLEAKSLLARLKKDLGFAATGERRLSFHCEARTIYEETYARAVAEDSPESAYYPGINAAALAVWCGDGSGSARLAREVLALLKRLEIADDEADRYWRRATEVEAYLLLGELDEVRQRIASLREYGEGRVAQIATTERQLRRIAKTLALPEDFLGPLCPPAVIHFTGHIIQARGKTGRFPAEQEQSVRERIDELLAHENVGSGYGSLAAGADILFAEALLARGAALHVIFPFTKPEFIEYSVAPSGERWLGRFHACLAEASSVQFATEDSFLQHERLFQYCSQLAMGLAVLAARHLQAAVMQCVVWDGVAAGGPGGTVVDMKAWQQAKLPQHIVRCGGKEEADDLACYQPNGAPASGGGREIRAMLFGDVHGFSKLRDGELPAFTERIMGPVGEAVHRFREKMSFVNTWGDGIFAVFEDVREAANWALEVQAKMLRIDLAAAGLPGHLQLRLGGHLGPVYQLMDPVLERLNFYGAHVSRAARIEPVTPEGCVYVTETFAAVLALEDTASFACDYVGYTEMAKKYGRLRIFLLRRTCGETGPTVLGDIERAPLQNEGRMSGVVHQANGDGGVTGV